MDLGVVRTSIKAEYGHLVVWKRTMDLATLYEQYMAFLVSRFRARTKELREARPKTKYMSVEEAKHRMRPYARTVKKTEYGPAYYAIRSAQEKDRRMSSKKCD